MSRTRAILVGPGALRIAVTVGLVLSLGAGAWCFQRYGMRRQEARTTAEAHIGARIVEAGQTLGKSLANLERLANDLADRLSTGKVPYAELDVHLRAVIDKDGRIFQLGLAFAPHMFADDVRLHVPYYRRERPGAEPVWVDQMKEGYDYTEPREGYAWYHQTLARGSRWNRPYYDQDTESSLIEYTAPFYKEGKPAGVVYINYSLHGLGHYLRSLDLGATSYATILDGAGALVYHPIAEHATRRRVRDAEQRGNQRILELFAQGERSAIAHHDPFARASAQLFLAPIEQMDWVLAVHHFEPDLDIDEDAERRDLFLASLALLLALTCGFIRLACIPAGWSKRSLQLLSAFVSIWLVLGICFLWYVSALARERSSAIHQTTAADSLARPITNEMALHRFQSDHTGIAGAHAPVYLPTGVFVQSLAFSGAYTVEVSGYIWQKYTRGMHDDLTRGFLMPEAVAVELEEIYSEQPEPRERGEADRTETVAWRFQATLRQGFDYARYPLDGKDVWIRLRHRDFHRNVVLVPDLEAYDLVAPHLLPGLEKDIVLEGWRAAETFFDYRLIDYSTNFGMDHFVGQAEVPELHFNVILKRVFLNAFIKNVVPLIVIAMILFATLMTVTLHDDKVSIFGFNTSGVLAACSGLFFAVLLAHIQLRDSFAIPEVLYLEYFDFVIYLMILLVALDVFLFTSGPRLRFLTYENNFLPKVLYWPVLLATLYAITFVVFV